MSKQTFALYFGNRGFMPAELIAGARRDMVRAVTDAGYGYLMMDENATRYGAVETRDEGRIYARWLKAHEGEYDGVILCMPIFIDENGAAAALQDAGVPILMQAYPDGNFPVFEGHDHMQYQIRDPKGFAEMLCFIAEHDRMPELEFIRK